MDPVLPYALGTIGAVATISGYFDLRLAREVASWPVVRGELLSARLRPALPGFGAAIPEVHFRYRVGGEVYEGDRLSYRRFRYYSKAERALYRVLDPGPVDVHYDPKRPERAVLLPGAGYMPGFAFTAGLLLLMLAFGWQFLAAV